ncbi:MAG: hypothetical protein K2X93_18240 [Candidatus Obscuribacterales bacterium]|nr:hypothetical protein [Candidatus Obscuribacterales bacterium]
MSAVVTLIRRLDRILHQQRQMRKASRNPWFSIPLDEAVIGADITDNFDGEGLALAVLASTGQELLVGYLYSAAHQTDAVPVSKDVVLQVLRDRAHYLKIDSRRKYRLPWEFGQPLKQQMVEVEAFLPTVDNYWHGEMIQSGVVCKVDGKLILAPIFHVLAEL